MQCIFRCVLTACRYTNNFRPYRQGDAHELMRCILDAVRMEEFEVCYRDNNNYYVAIIHFIRK